MGYGLGGGNASLVVERVVQVFDGDSLKLLQESVDSQPGKWTTGALAMRKVLIRVREGHV